MREKTEGKLCDTILVPARWSLGGGGNTGVGRIRSHWGEVEGDEKNRQYSDDQQQVHK